MFQFFSINLDCWDTHHNLLCYSVGGHRQAGLQHALARTQDGPQRQRRLVQGRDHPHPRHHQALLDPWHCHPWSSQVCCQTPCNILCSIQQIQHAYLHWQISDINHFIDYWDVWIFLPKHKNEMDETKTYFVYQRWKGWKIINLRQELNPTWTDKNAEDRNSWEQDF